VEIDKHLFRCRRAQLRPVRRVIGRNECIALPDAQWPSQRGAIMDPRVHRAATDARHLFLGIIGIAFDIDDKSRYGDGDMCGCRPCGLPKRIGPQICGSMRLHCKFSVAERELIADRCRDVEASMRGMNNKPAGKVVKCHAHDQAITSRRGVRRLKPYSFMVATESVRAERGRV